MWEKRRSLTAVNRLTQGPDLLDCCCWLGPPFQARECPRCECPYVTCRRDVGDWARGVFRSLWRGWLGAAARSVTNLRRGDRVEVRGPAAPPRERARARARARAREAVGLPCFARIKRCTRGVRRSGVLLG